MSEDIRERITNPNETVEFRLGEWPLVRFLAATIPISIIIVLIFADPEQWYFYPLLGAVCMTWVEMACFGLHRTPPTLMLTEAEVISPPGGWRLSWDQVAYFECDVADYLSDVHHLGVNVYQKGCEKPYRADGFFTVPAQELEKLLRQRLFAYRMSRSSQSSSLSMDDPKRSLC